MKSSERNELLVQQTAAAVEQATALRDIDHRLASLEAGQRRRESLQKLPPLPRRRFRRLDGLPGWDARVPDEHIIEGSTVKCRCGAETILSLRIPMACTGECGRWFLLTDAGVMWKLLPE